MRSSNPRIARRSSRRDLLLTICIACSLVQDGFSFAIIKTKVLLLPSTQKLAAQQNTEATTTTMINGEPPEDPFAVLENLNATVHDRDMLPAAPPLSYEKFLTMQDKRVVVTIRYSGESGLRPYFLTVAKKLKASHPDVVVERRILPGVELGGEAIFEILVDGTVVVGQSKSRRSMVGSVDMRARSVFVSMQELDVAISRARRRRRPSTVYGEDITSTNLRKE